MQAQGFWSRVGTWFHNAEQRGGRRGAADVALTRRRGGAWTDSPSSGGEDAFSAAGAALSQTTTLLTSREATLDRLQEAFAKVTGLVASIEDHLERQDRRSEATAEALDRLATVLGPLTDVTTTQGETLVAIRDLIRAGDARVRCLEDNLVQWPKIADAQREATAAVNHRLDDTAATTERLAATLETFRGSVDLLGESVVGSANTIREVQRDDAKRHDLRAARLESQSRKLTILASATFGLAVAMIVVVLIVVS